MAGEEFEMVVAFGIFLVSLGLVSVLLAIGLLFEAFTDRKKGD